jgi:opacity protein-like surface antigen
MTRHLSLLTVLLLVATPAAAQSSDDGIGVRGFASVGNISFTARESFDAVLDTSSGPIVGGGAQVLLPWGLYVEVSAARFRREGERAFVGPAPNHEVFKLGIPLEVTITPLDVTGGWRWRRWDRIVPYGGVGFSSYRYQETSDFADPDENVDERYSGFHVVAGAEYALLRWLAVGGELSWSSIPNAIGEAGVSQVFNEDNLGGRTIRLKISVGR